MCFETDITLDDLAKIKLLNARNLNICRQNNLDSLSKIMNFYKREGSFKYRVPHN